MKKVSNSKALSWLALTTVMTIAAGALLAIFATWKFGSVSAGVAYLAGDRIVADAKSKSFGRVSAGQNLHLEFQLKNLLSRPVQIIGTRLSCTCTVAEGAPMTIPPSGSAKFRVTVRTGSRSGDIQEYVYLFTDYSDQREIVLRVVGKVDGSAVVGQSAGKGTS